MTDSDFGRIPATMDNVQKFASLYGYAVHGDTASGECDIEFPGAFLALHFRNSMSEWWAIDIRKGDVIADLDGSVVMTVQLERTEAEMNDDWARAFVARVADFDRLAERRAEVGKEEANEEAALTLDLLIRDARIALGSSPDRVDPAERSGPA